jgi:hypothetical protein
MQLIHLVIDHIDFVMFYLNLLNLLFDLMKKKKKKIFINDESLYLPRPDCRNKSVNSCCESF